MWGRDAAAKGQGKPVSQVRFRPLLPRSENIICMAVNYMEDGTLAGPALINAFMKSPSAINGRRRHHGAEHHGRNSVPLPHTGHRVQGWVA
jgi:2-keto-4-pentenoate hydratase/2-oxohepta-3-ene-1,7-dioic acid hydratase in catechol pathway